MTDFWLTIAGFFAAAVVSSFVEYFVHILMHRRIFLGRTHRNHHADPDSENWFKQFAYYVLGSIPPMVAIGAVTWYFEILAFGIGVAAGFVVWAAWVAWAHTLQHEKPEMVFWMKLPVHHLHHEYEMSRHNFGLSVDWWDRLFGTYKPMPWVPNPNVQFSFRGLLAIRWF